MSACRELPIEAEYAADYKVTSRIMTFRETHTVDALMHSELWLTSFVF